MRSLHRRPEPIEECMHSVVVGSLSPAVNWLTQASGRSMHFRRACPDCGQRVDIRFWRSEAGAWYLKLREHLAEGRKWLYHYDGAHWVASL